MRKSQQTPRRSHRGRSTIDLAFEAALKKRVLKEIKALFKEIEERTEAEYTAKTAKDARAPKTGSFFIIEIMKDIRQKWYKRFRDMAKELAPLMKDRINARTQKQIELKMKDYGFTFDREVTPEEEEALRKIEADFVESIGSIIPKMCVEMAQEAIIESYKRGGDWHYCTKRLHRIYWLDMEQSALRVRDQMNRATQSLAMVNAKKAGCTRARWVHVQGAHSSRISHERMNGKEFDLETGLYDPDVGRNVKPAELYYCNCQFEIIIPAFEG